MPGIFSIYTGFADGHVHLRQKKGNVEHISRAKVELQILNEIDKADISISLKMSWYHAVLASSNFDNYWVSVASRNDLPDSCTARYVPDDSLLEYELPTEDEDEEDTVNAVDLEADDYAEEELQRETHDETPDNLCSPPALITEDTDTPPSPDSSDDSSSSDMSDRGSELHPLHFVQFKHIIPYCDKCKESGHSTIACRVNNEPWTIDDWESVDSDDYEDGHEAKQQCRCMFLAGLPSVPGQPGRNVEEWLTTVDVDREFFYSALGVECPPRKEKHDDACEEEEDGLCEKSSKSKDKGKGRDMPVTVNEGEDEGAYEESPSKTKAKGKAKAPSTLKNISKPKGITKTKATPRKKKENPTAQLLLAASKTLGPAQPQIEQEASTTMPTTPAQAPSETSDNSAPAPATKAPIEAQGTKRTLEEITDEQEAEEDTPATKKFKTGGAASPNGGRKMATPKKKIEKVGETEL